MALNITLHTLLESLYLCDEFTEKKVTLIDNKRKIEVTIGQLREFIHDRYSLPTNLWKVYHDSKTKVVEDWVNTPDEIRVYLRADFRKYDYMKDMKDQMMKGLKDLLNELLDREKELSKISLCDFTPFLQDELDNHLIEVEVLMRLLKSYDETKEEVICENWGNKGRSDPNRVQLLKHHLQGKSFLDNLENNVPVEKSEEKGDLEKILDEIETDNTEDKNLYDVWKKASIDDKFQFVCSSDDIKGCIYFDSIYLERYTDELKDIKVDTWVYMDCQKLLQVWLDCENFMKIKRRKSIYGNPICGTMIRVFTICDEDFVTLHDSSSRDPNDSFMVKWKNVPQEIKEEIGKCTNNMLRYNFDLEENAFYWSFSLNKCQFNHIVNLLTDYNGF